MLKKTVAVILSLALILSVFAGCGKAKTAETDTTETSQQQTKVQKTFTEKAGLVKKSETVYVNVDNYGSVKSTEVTDWIHTDKPCVVVNDISGLKNITNVKSDIQPVEKDGMLQWNMDTTDLYYSGTSDKKLPVDIELKYYLNGVETKAEDIAGASGKVKIDITMKNNISKEITDASGKATIYLPVLVAGVAIFPEGEYSGVSVTNGKSIGDGTKEIAITLGMPGLKESMEMTDDALKSFSSFDLSGKCSISADTENFELGNLYFAVLPLCSLDLGLVMPDNMEELTENLQKLKKVLNTVETMDISDVFTMITNDSDKLADLTSMIEEAVKLYNSNKALIAVLEKYFTGENLDVIMKLLKDADAASLKEAVDMLSNPVLQTFFKDLPTLTKDLEELAPILDALDEDMKDPEVKAAFDNLPETLNTLSELQDKLEENSELLDAMSVLVSSENIDTITALVDELSGFDFNGMVSEASALFGDSDSILDRAKEWIAFGMDYRIFSDAADDMDTSLLFVYRTDALEKSDVTASEQQTETSQPVEDKPWYKKIFK